MNVHFQSYVCVWVSVFIFTWIFLFNQFRSPTVCIIFNVSIYKIMLSLSPQWLTSNVLIFTRKKILIEKKTWYTEKIHVLFAYRIHFFWYINSVPERLKSMLELCTILLLFWINMRLKMSLLVINDKKRLISWKCWLGHMEQTRPTNGHSMEAVSMVHSLPKGSHRLKCTTFSCKSCYNSELDHRMEVDVMEVRCAQQINRMW